MIAVSVLKRSTDNGEAQSRASQASRASFCAYVCVFWEAVSVLLLIGAPVNCVKYSSYKICSLTGSAK